MRRWMMTCISDFRWYTLWEYEGIWVCIALHTKASKVTYSILQLTHIYVLHIYTAKTLAYQDIDFL
jgi:hypothetical protein